MEVAGLLFCRVAIPLVRAQVSRFAKEFREQGVPLNVLVNNAGQRALSTGSRNTARNT